MTLNKYIFSVNVDFSQRELLNAVLQNLFQAPLIPIEGQVYYDSLYNVPHYWNENEWIPWERPIHRKYNSQAEMIGDQQYQLKQFIYYDGMTYWEYLGTTNGDITDYNLIFNITLTTFGNSGAATLNNSTLNIPEYSIEGLGGVPISRTLTINDISFDLSSDRSWTIPTHDPVTIGISNGLSLVGQEISLALASSGVTGSLSNTDWIEFDSKIGGLISNGQVAYGGDDNNIQGESSFKYNSTDKILTIENGSIVLGLEEEIPLISKHKTYIYDGIEPLFRYQTYYYTNNINNFVSTYGYGFGHFSLQNNTGSRSNGFGQSSLLNNTGLESNGFGHFSLQNNTGTSSNGFGYSTLSSNIGNSSNGFGNFALQNNIGNSSNGFGNFALQNNIGNFSNGFGLLTLRYNQGVRNTVIGAGSFSMFYENIAGEKSITPDEVDIVNNQINIPLHGFGLNNEYKNIKYTVSGAAIGGLFNNAIYQIQIIDENTIKIKGKNLTTVGFGVHTFTPQFEYTNVNILGSSVQPTQSNQNIIGNTDSINTLLHGTVTITNINNLFNPASSVLVPDPMNVVSYRTLSELAIDGDFVTYTGATKNVDLGEFGLTTEFIQFNINPTLNGIDPGKLIWSPDDETLFLGLDANVTHIIGQETFYLVKNQTGSTIPKGTVVRADGTLGNSGRILIAPFIADGTFPSKFMIGVTTEEITNGSDGFVTAFGKIRKIDTSIYPEGTILYASSTVSGGFVDTAPIAPNNIISVAIVVTSDNNNGEIFVRPTYGSNINNDEGVQIINPLLNNLLVYDDVTGLWINKSFSQLGGVLNTTSLTFNTVNGITGGTTQTLESDRTWTFGLTGQALSFHNLSTNGYIVRIGTDNIVTREIIGGDGITVINGDGISGNTIISLSESSYLFGEDIFIYSGSTEFTLSINVPYAVEVFLNGQRLVHNLDWTIINNVVTLTQPLDSDKPDEIVITYFYNTPDIVLPSIIGSGDLNFITKWDGSNSVTNSSIQDDGTTVILSTSTSFTSVPNAINNTNKFLVLDGTILKYRTDLEILSDIGGIGGTLTAGRIPFATGSKTLSDDIDLVWDNLSKRFGINILNPDSAIDVFSNQFPVGSFKRETSLTGGSLSIISGVASGYSLRTISTGDMVDGFGGGIVFSIQDISSSSLIDSNIIGRIYARRDGADNRGSMQFFVTGSLATTPSITIRNSGNVGFATADPTEIADINGNIRIRSLTTTQGDFVQADSNGVFNRRTAAQVLTQIGAAPISHTHNASQITSGTFGLGDYIFQNNLIINGQVYSPIYDKGNSGTGTVTFNWDDGNKQIITLTGNPTFVFSNPQSGGDYQIIITQDDLGGKSITWPTDIKWKGGITPTLTGSANSEDIVTISYDGTSYYAIFNGDFKIA